MSAEIKPIATAKTCAFGSTIAILDELAERAERGEIREVAVAYVTQDDKAHWEHSASTNRNHLVAAVTRLFLAIGAS